jgi:hypothetical protein
MRWTPGMDNTLWRIEVASWGRLESNRRREFLELAGDFSGEWWGNGCFVVSGVAEAQRLSRSARARGFCIHVRSHSE